MNNDFSSDYEQEEFQKDLAKYEEMVAGKTTAYFDADQLYDIAYYYATKGMYQKSEEVVDYALQVHPDDTDLLLFKARGLAYHDNLDHAWKILNNIPDQTDNDVRLLKTEFYLLEDKTEQADEVTKLALLEDGNMDRDKYIDFTNLYMESQLFSKAITWLEKIFLEFPEDIEIQEMLAECYSEEALLAKAEKIYNHLIDTDPYSTSYWNEIAKCQFNQKEYKKAIESCEFSLAINSENPKAYLLIGQAYSMLENNEKAVKYLVKASNLLKDEEFPPLLAGMTYFILKEYKQATQYYLEALNRSENLSPFQVEIYKHLALSFSKLQDISNAMAFINNAIDLEPEMAELYIYKACIYLQKQKEKSALKYFIKAISTEKEHPDLTYMHAGTACIEYNNFDMAKEIFECMEKDYPANSGLSIYMAYISLHNKDEKNFRTLFIDAVNHTPERVSQFIELLPEELGKTIKLSTRGFKVRSYEDPSSGETKIIISEE